MAGRLRFFDEDGQPSQAVKDVLGLLTQVAHDRQVTQRIVALLANKVLIQPWAIKIRTEVGERAIKGLYRIEEARLNDLGWEDLKAFQEAEALPLAYTCSCHRCISRKSWASWLKPTRRRHCSAA